MVADGLADIAHRHKTQIGVRRLQDLPQAARQAAIADHLGLWNFKR